MTRLGFLVSKRWAIFLLVVLFLSWGAWQLGQWQFHRLDDRQARNAIVENNERLPPAPVEEVMKTDAPADPADEWRVVEATGTYDSEDTVIVRYRTRNGAAGVDVVVPLVLPDGTALVVDRGWWPTKNRGEVPDDIPSPPSGEVTVTGWLRLDATGDSAEVTDQSTRAINSSEIAEALDREVLSGFIDVATETPEPDTALTRAELPELDDGPHFFYGLQWWFFGALAIFGFFYLLFDEWRDRKAESQRSEHAAVDGKHNSAQV